MFIQIYYKLRLPFPSKAKFFKKNMLYSFFFLFLIFSFKEFFIIYLPKRRFHFSSYKAPIAHKSFSKEHYSWILYKIVILTPALFVPFFNKSIVNLIIFFSLFFKKLLLFGTTTSNLYSTAVKIKFSHLINFKLK